MLTKTQAGAIATVVGALAAAVVAILVAATPYVPCALAPTPAP